MGLRLILGRAGSGKTEQCMQEIAGELQRYPRGTPLLYLVPEQATFHTEYNLSTRRGLGGAIRAQVLSFQRLAWRVLQEQGGRDRFFIDDTGKSMLLRRLLEQHQEKLHIFGQAGEQAGGIENLVQLYNEFKRSGVDPEQLQQTLTGKKKETMSASFLYKLQDLHLLFQALEQEVEGNFLDAEDTLTVLQLGIPGSAFVQEARVWVDGFYGFTNQEYAVLEALLQRCQEVVVTVCLEENVPPGVTIDELDSFFPAALTCQQLQELAARAGAPVEIEVLERNGRHRFACSPALEHLERYLHEYPAVTCELEEEAAGIRLISAANRRCEVEAAARALIGLARDRGYRWREMAVITGDPEAYEDLVRTLFQDYRIPYFLDRARPVLHHPLVEFLRSALEVAVHNWRYDSVFRCIKTDFLFPLPRREQDIRLWRERADRLENYVLAFGIQGRSRWEQGRWDFLEQETLEDLEQEGEQEQEQEQDEHGEHEQKKEQDEAKAEAKREEKGPSKEQKQFLESINRTRDTLAAPLVRFHQELGRAKTVREKARALFGLVEEARVAERLEQMIRHCTEQGLPEKAREHRQVYDGIIDLLDQLVEAMGGETVTTSLFARLLETGMENMRLSLVPPSLDQVLVGNVDRTRVNQVRCAFVLGVNDGCLPSPPPEDGVFTEEERESLIGWGLELAPGSRRRLLDEQFLVYMALTRASEGLWLSYALANEEGQGLVPALLLDRIKELFPALEEKTVEPEPPAVGRTFVSGTPSGDAGAGANRPESAADAPGRCSGETGDLDLPGEAAAAAAFDSGAGETKDDSKEGAAAGEPKSTETAPGEMAPGAFLEAWTPLSYIARPRRTLAHAAVQLGEAQKEAGGAGAIEISAGAGAAGGRPGERLAEVPLDPLWQDVYNWFATDPQWRETASRFLQGLTYRNRESPLEPRAALALYGQPLRAGVSRLEQHRACPFAHFAAYGLRLKERRVYRLEAPDIGRFFHVILRNIALRLISEGRDWSQLSREESHQAAREQVEQLAPRLQKEILLSSSRYQHLSRKLTDTVGRAVHYLGEHARRGRFSTVGAEVEFGRDKILPEPPLDLGQGRSLELVGRVDRVDLARDEEEGEAFVRIVDYKSGPERLDLLEVYHGLSLQILIYLDIVLRHLPEWLGLQARPAGIFYYPLRTPILSCSQPPDEEALEREMLKQYKMQGRVLAEPRVVRLMDSQLESGSSPIIPVGIKKSGDFYEYASVLSQEEFEWLQAHARSLAQETARSVYAGEVDIRPVRLGQKAACKHCPYRPVCQFDPGLQDNNYRFIPAGKELISVSKIMYKYE